MAAVVVTGSGNRLPWYRRWLTGGILRRQIVTAITLVALVFVLLFTPEVSTTTSSNVQLLPGMTPPTPPGGAGTTVGGVICSPGVRQVPFSEYAPQCQPKWTGHNGGPTAPGVTATTINLVYREAATDELALLYTLLPQSIVGTNDEAIATVQKYVDTFNKYFELYGRKVVLVPYQGQGNFINEDTGTGSDAAAADALTVKTSLHGFVDMSLIDSSVIYTKALQSQGVISFGLYLQSADFYTQNTPWQFTNGPNCAKTADAIGSLAGKGMAGHKAGMASEASLQTKNRTFGIVYPDNPQSALCEQLIVKALARYGITPKVTVAVPFDISSLITSSSNAIAQFQAAGVTTVIDSSSDPITPIYFLKAATSTGYGPEWLLQSYFAGGANTIDGFVQDDISKAGADSLKQGNSILALGNNSVPRAQQEAIKAFEESNNGSADGILPSYPFAYGDVLYFFDLLQAAGPNLTAANLAGASANTSVLIPSGPGGEMGGWTFGAGMVDPSSTYQLLRWSNTTISTQNGQPGTFLPCYGGQVFTYTQNGKDVPSTPASCGGNP